MSIKYKTQHHNRLTSKYKKNLFDLVGKPVGQDVDDDK